MMKFRKIVALLILISLVFSLCSCSIIREENKILSKIPYTSEKFSQEFMDSFDSEYRLYDSNLYYLSANPFEVRTSDYSGVFQYDVDALFISTIENVPKEEFVAVTHFGKFILMPGGGRDITCHVYQRNDAPIPMKDYTISSVSIIGTYNYPDYYITEGKSGLTAACNGASNYFETFLESEDTSIVAEYNLDDNSAMIASLKDSYSNSIKYDRSIDVDSIYTCDEGDEFNRITAVYYYLLFEFEEAENLVWCVSIGKDPSDNLYYSFYYYEFVTKTSNGTEYLVYENVHFVAPISEEVEEIIRDAIKYEIH